MRYDVDRVNGLGSFPVKGGLAWDMDRHGLYV